MLRRTGRQSVPPACGQPTVDVASSAVLIGGSIVARRSYGALVFFRGHGGDSAANTLHSAPPAQAAPAADLRLSRAA